MRKDLNLEQTELRSFAYIGTLKQLGLIWDRCARILEARRCRLEGICMDQEYLPGDVRDRIGDLCDEVKKILGLRIRHRSLW